MSYDELRKDIERLDEFVRNAEEINREEDGSFAAALGRSMGRLRGLLYLNIALTIGLIGALFFGVL